MRRLTLLILTLFSSNTVHAISNIENERPGLPKEGLDSKISMKIAGKTGNKREQDYKLSTKFIYRKQQNVYLLLAETSYGKTRNFKDTDETFTHFRWTHFYRPRWGA